MVSVEKTYYMYLKKIKKKTKKKMEEGSEFIPLRRNAIDLNKHLRYSKTCFKIEVHPKKNPNLESNRSLKLKIQFSPE